MRPTPLGDRSPLVKLNRITKRFGPVTACDQVDLVLGRGRIHGILGENGAGKSTLMKVLIGLVVPDAGSIEIDGARQQINDPVTAAGLGIAMVHQHFSLVDALSVWENVTLGETGRLDPVAVQNRIGEISEHYGLEIDPGARVGGLTAGQRQRVEVIKCLRRDPSIVIFDEPTSVLTPEESSQLFSSFREVVAAEGRAVVLVSHKLDEVLDATDEITIMRHGKVVDHVVTADADARSLARAMVGRSVSLRTSGPAVGFGSSSEPPDPALVKVKPVLQITDLAVSDKSAGVLDGLSLQVSAGEILGIAGVDGNGQRVLADVLSSLVPTESGTVAVDGVKVSTDRPGSMMVAGIGVIAEDRHHAGVVLDMTVAENLVLANPYQVSKRGIIKSEQIFDNAERLIEEFEIQCSGPDAPLWTLSGGNQQRVVLARELDQNPKVLVAAHPTRGLDVGAIEYMNKRLRATAQAGVAVLLISSELEELLHLSDRIAVIYRGKIVGEMDRAEADVELIGLLMGGALV